MSRSLRAANLKQPLNCFKCGQQGHISSNCPKATEGCYKCHKEGHISSNCPQIVDKCFNCGYAGHWAKDCSKPSKVGADKLMTDAYLQQMAAKYCTRCELKGHDASICPKNNIAPHGTCYNCGKLGHLARDCPNK